MLTEVDYRTGRGTTCACSPEGKGVRRRHDLRDRPFRWRVPYRYCRLRRRFRRRLWLKYLNSGPGAPAFIYVRPDLQARAAPALLGSMGDAAAFAFERSYGPAPGIDCLRVGTAPVLSMVALNAALDVFDGVNMATLGTLDRASEDFVRRIEGECPELQLVSPRDPARRGAQARSASRKAMQRSGR